MWQQELIWFFAIIHQEFRKNNPIAFEVLMVLAIAHVFGFYNPKQLADFLDLPHQKFYAELKDWSVYYVKKMLLRFIPTVSLGVTSALVYTYGCGDGRIGPTRCAVIDAGLDGRYSKCRTCRTPPAAAGSA